jgi:hypothetical protein
MKRHSVQILLYLCVLSVTTLGQEFRATVTGRVTDPSRAVVPNATVLVRNIQTNEAVSVNTNSEGVYNAPFLRPGVYSITVEAPGFKKYIRDRQELQVGQTATIDVLLDVGATTETVTITGEAALLEETKADRGNVIENRRIVELPLNARNPFMLSTLTPGITYNGPAIYQRPFDNGAIADWSINGGLNRSNEFLLDGAPNNSIQGGNNIAYVPPVDAVGEFKIITNSYDAQYGRTAGGVVNVQIKSGGNQYHGSLYEFYRRNWLDSNYLFSNARGIPAGRFRAADGTLVKAEHFLDQYGGQIDGPVWLPKSIFGPAAYDGRDRTFFLFNYEGYREGTPNPGIVTVPTEEFLRGDFRNLRNAAGQLIQLYDPATGSEVNGQFVRQPLRCNGVNNVICPERINPIAKALLQYYPKANTTTPGTDPWRNNYADIPNIADDKFKNWIFKVDQVLGQKDRVFFRYGYNIRKEIRWTNAITTGPAQDGQLPLERINYAGVADWVHTFNSNLVLNVRAAANRYIEAARSEPGLNFDSAQLGFPASLTAQLPTKMFPRIEITDFISLGRGNFSREPTNVFSFQPNISLTRSAHSLRFGLDMRYTQYARQVSDRAGMLLRFERTFTRADFSRDDNRSGNGFASFLLGAPNFGQIDFNVFPIYMFKYYAPWIQDDWKLTRRLTINLGFRYDLNMPAVERYNRLNYGFDTTAVNPVTNRVDKSKLPPGVTQLLGGLGFVGVNGNPESPIKFDKNNFQARVGAAFSINDKTVLRGGYGRYFVNPVGAPGYPTNGFSVQTPFVGSNNGNRTPLFNLSNPFPNGVLRPAGAGLGLETFLGRGFTYSNTDFNTPYVENFSLAIQRQLPWNSVIEVSYVGSRTHDAQSQFNGINEPSLQFRNQCDPTKGGDPRFCNEQLPNPFKGVAGFEGTNLFTADRISRYDLNRPFPQFAGINQSDRNDGRVWYNSLQVLFNKRLSQGLTLSSTYTFSKTIEQGIQQPGQQDDTNSFIDQVARTLNRSLAFSDRPHRFTLSGVWEIPVGKGRKFMGGSGRLVDAILGGWELAPLYVFNSGRPWQLGTAANGIEIVDPNFKLDDTVRVVNGIEYIQAVKPCVGTAVKNSDGSYRRDSGGNLVYALTSYSTAYGCTSPNFVIREPFQERRSPYRTGIVRRQSFHQFDLNFSKRFRITERTSFQFRLEAYNVTNTPMYDERVYINDPNNSEFGSINKNTVRQSNFPRFFQLGFKFIF